MPWHSPCALSSLIFDLSKTNALPFSESLDSTGSLSTPISPSGLLKRLRFPPPSGSLLYSISLSSLRYEVFKVRIRGMYLFPNLSVSEMFFRRLSRGKTRSWRTFKTIHEGKSRLRVIPDGLPVLCPALRPALRFRFAPRAFLFVSVLPLRLSPLRFPETIDLG